jgi:hypothetical protein
MTFFSKLKLMLEISLGKVRVFRTFFVSGIFAVVSAGAALAFSTEEIKQRMISESLRQYSGSCPCPYNTDRAGRSCGRRSAYSKPGGASPLCYPGDISSSMVEDYARRNKLPRN